MLTDRNDAISPVQAVSGRIGDKGNVRVLFVVDLEDSLPFSTPSSR